MANYAKTYTDEQIIRAHQAYPNSIRAASGSLGMSRAAFRKRLEQLKLKSTPIEIDPRPSKFIPIEDLIEHRKKLFRRRQEYEEASKLIQVKVKMDGPIGISHFGDPHVDDDGCDLPLLEKHTEIIQKTEGLFAGNVGDTTNNWVGRLARLYGSQSTSEAEAWRIAEWFLQRVEWLYVIGGNHDCWSGEQDPIKWILDNALYEPFEVRLNLCFPNGREVRINGRHDFKGQSIYNNAHGPTKAAMMGWRDHILICGHRHMSGYNIVKDPATGLLSHAIRVSSYKVYDRYAKESGFMDQAISPNVVTIIDPAAKDEAGLIQVFHDLELAADFLGFLRKRK